MTPEILAETIHVLRSYYEFPQPEIAQAIERVILHVGVTLSDETVMTEALYSYANTNPDIADCLLAARAHDGNHAIASFDKDFKKFDDIEILEF